MSVRYPGILGRGLRLGLLLLTVPAAGTRAAVTLDLAGVDLGGFAEVRAFVGRLDVTGLVRITGPTSISVEDAYLDPGGATLQLDGYLEDGTRESLGRVRLPARTEAASSSDGGEASWRFAQRVELGNESQWREEVSGDAFPSPRRTYHDVTGRLGLSAERGGSAWTLRGNVNLFGASHREQALRFGEEGAAAPRLDLSDYRVELAGEHTALSIGHVQFGRHPLLVDAVASRGVSLLRDVGARVHVSAASVNGSRIVGYQNLFGLESLDHNISSAALAVDLLGKGDADLELRAVYLDASVENRVGFETGEVPDAEHNTGYGLVLEGRSGTGRLEGRLAWSRSDYSNPQDPVLAQGFDVVPVEAETRDAVLLELRADVLRRPASGRTLTWRGVYRRVDPLYRSAASFVGADQALLDQSLSYQGRAVSASLRYARSEDNLDDIPTILKTRTRQWGANASLAPSGWLDAPPVWLPNLTLALQRVHQYAANDPDPALSGFNGGSHLPDQVSRVADLRMSWGIDWWSLDYGLSYSTQDNRQPGREAADFANLGHSVGIDLRPVDALSLGLSGGRTRNADEENGLVAYTDTVNANVGWNPGEAWALTASYSASDGFDSQSVASRHDTSLMLQAGRRFSLPMPGESEAAGQVYLRFARQRSSSRDNVFAFATAARTWVVQSGLTVSY